MSKRRKNRLPDGIRKVRAIPGTIFDKSLIDDTAARQRRCGLFYMHGVNPSAVAAKTTDVESLGGGRVRVYFEAIYLPLDQKEWPGSHNGRQAVPQGVWCEHGGAHKAHKVKQIRHFDAELSEVLA